MRTIARLAWVVLVLSLFSCSGGDTDSGGGGSSADYKFLYEHNAQYLDGHTVRWDTPINVYTNGISGAEAAFAKWGLAYNFVNSPPSQGITLNWSSSNSYCGLTNTYYYNSGRIYRAVIYINPNQAQCRGGLENTLAHEAAHALGFFGHTSDGGLMDPDGGNSQITPQVRNMMNLLYSHPNGWNVNTYLMLKERLLGRYQANGSQTIVRVDY